jgi:hypothetical protein
MRGLEDLRRLEVRGLRIEEVSGCFFSRQVGMFEVCMHEKMSTDKVFGMSA